MEKLYALARTRASEKESGIVNINLGILILWRSCVYSYKITMVITTENTEISAVENMTKQEMSKKWIND